MSGAAAVGILGAAALVGFFFIPTPIESARFVGPFLTVIFIPFTWGAFRLVRPSRYGRAWLIAEFIVVPVLWLLLVIALGIWFGHIGGPVIEELLRPRPTL